MTNTTINIPGLPAGLTVSTTLRNTATLAEVETVNCTDTANGYTGTVTGSHADLFCFDILLNGIVADKQFRTIADDAGPYVISTDLESLEQMQEAHGTSGNGPYAVTITIEDGDTNSLQDATVVLTEGVDEFIKTTDSSGEAVFGLSAVTYDVLVRKPGYSSHVGTLTIADASPHTITVTANGTVTPSTDPARSTGVLVVRDEFGDPEASQPVSLQLTTGPGTAGSSPDTKVRTEISSESVVIEERGIVTFEKLLVGATYAIWRGAAPTVTGPSLAARSTGDPVTFTVLPGGDFLLPEILGSDAETA